MHVGHLPGVTGVDVSDAVRSPETAPLVPGRLRKPLVHAVRDAMPGEWCHELSRWLFEHRGEMTTQSVVWRGAHDLLDLQDRCPGLAAKFRARLLESLPDALGPCGIADFDITGVGMRASLMHRHCHRGWMPEADAEAPHVRIAYELTMHTDPKMFEGGEREFLSGDAVEPESGLLMWMHPLQASRIREVECWSMHALDGRWSVWGEILGPAPEGWDRVIAMMTGAR